MKMVNLLFLKLLLWKVLLRPGEKTLLVSTKEDSQLEQQQCHWGLEDEKVSWKYWNYASNGISVNHEQTFSFLYCALHFSS